MKDNFDEKNIETLKKPFTMGDRTYRPVEKSRGTSIKYSSKSLKKSAEILIDAD